MVQEVLLSVISRVYWTLQIFGQLSTSHREPVEGRVRPLAGGRASRHLGLGEPLRLEAARHLGEQSLPVPRLVSLLQRGLRLQTPGQHSEIRK